MDNRVLLTSLGNNPKTKTYHWGDKSAVACQSPAALLKLLPDERRPEEVIVLVTPEAARITLPRFEKELNLPGLKLRPVQIPLGRSEAELWKGLQAILQTVPANCQLTLDVTHAFRSVAFLFFTAVFYLQALRGVTVQAAYYGMEEQPNSNDAFIVDISLLLEMVRWTYATRIFLDTGEAKELSLLLAPFSGNSGANADDKINPTNASDYEAVVKLRHTLNRVSDAYMRALPVEFGIEAAELAELLEKPLPEHLHARLPLPEELFGEVHRHFAERKLPLTTEELSIEKAQIKKRLALDEAEIRRQVSLIDAYLENDHVNHAAGLMREWIITVVYWHRNKNTQGLVSEYLKAASHDRRFSREYIEGRLALLEDAYIKGSTVIPLTANQKWLAEAWRMIRLYRNDLHHHGFGERYVNFQQGRKKLEKVWVELKASWMSPDKWITEQNISRG
ncbi:CRISPR-associated DxTHG motif protein [Heliobacterium undosum]|uniref:CRISPR-associated DxTHG motif protein n=1 Tax=Heliomicrobium undosum TaxID=121734 RepID=A0A845L4K5_9FIRM|nr:TM1812 family CRISPR-associated protein [Heliomicrobium undosum]MZP30626.1 CRISPR-associated DxTHG motif protein [Heliomicrobium undosum]